MTNKQNETNNSEQGEMDEIIEGLHRVEQARKRKMLLITAALVVLGGLGLGAAYAYRVALFVPNLHIEEGEKEVLAETNDPQCRAFIAEVTQIGADLQTLDPKLEKGLLQDDSEKVKSLRADLGALSDRLKDANASSADANLRYDTSRTELKDWFGHIQNEIRIIDSVAENHLAKLEPAPPTEGDADAGTVVEFKDTKKAKKKRPPQERLDRALLTANDAFESFRVWHTSSLHPCGKAEGDETPWVPEKGAKSAGPSTSPPAAAPAESPKE